MVNVVSGGYPVSQPFVTNLSAVQTKLTGSEKNLVNATLPFNISPQVPENTHNLKDLGTTHFCTQHDILL